MGVRKERPAPVRFRRIMARVMATRAGHQEQLVKQVRSPRQVVLAILVEFPALKVHLVPWRLRRPPPMTNLRNKHSLKGVSGKRSSTYKLGR